MTNFFEEIKIFSTIVHVIGVVLGMGSALVADILFSFFSKDKKLNQTEINTLSFLSKIVLYGLVIISVSGIFVLLSDWEKYLTSAKFLSKMSILAILLANGYVLNRYVWPHLLDKDFFTSKRKQGVRKLAFASGAVSVISWVSVCILGIFEKLDLSYFMIMMIYLVIVSFGMSVSLLLEKIEFGKK